MSAVSLVLFMLRLHRLFMAERQEDNRSVSVQGGFWSGNSHVLRRLTAEGQQTGVCDRGLAQVQNLKTGQVLRQQPQPGVSELQREGSVRERTDPPGPWPGSGPRAPAYLRGPQVELFERRQLDELFGTGTGDVGESQAQVLQVPKGAGAQEPGQVRILRKSRKRGQGHQVTPPLDRYGPCLTVDLDGRVSLVGPPFRCCKDRRR